MDLSLLLPAVLQPVGSKPSALWLLGSDPAGNHKCSQQVCLLVSWPQGLDFSKPACTGEATFLCLSTGCWNVPFLLPLTCDSISQTQLCQSCFSLQRRGGFRARTNFQSFPFLPSPVRFQAGKTDRKEFVKKKMKLNPFASSTNKEKKKKKNFMMMRYSHNVRSKNKRSFREKQASGP